MGAGDAPRSDAERREPVRRSARGADRRGLRLRPKPLPLKSLWRCRRRDCGLQRAPSRRAHAPARYGRRPAGSPFGPS